MGTEGIEEKVRKWAGGKVGKKINAKCKAQSALRFTQDTSPLWDLADPIGIKRKDSAKYPERNRGAK